MIVTRIDLTGLSMTKQNGFRLLDISEYVSPGEFTITNNVDDGIEKFNVIDVTGYSVTVNVVDDTLKITTSNQDKLKYINVIYKSNDPNEKGANMCYIPKFVNGVMTIPRTIQTDDIGSWTIQTENVGEYVNAIFETDYDTNTFFVDGEGDVGC